MVSEVFRFQFDDGVELDDAEMSLHLAIFAVEGLFGQARVRLDAGYALLPELHGIEIDADSEVGVNLVRIFTALLVREFGEDVFHVERVDPADCCEPISRPKPEEVAA